MRFPPLTRFPKKRKESELSYELSYGLCYNCFMDCAIIVLWSPTHPCSLNEQLARPAGPP